MEEKVKSDHFSPLGSHFQVLEGNPKDRDVRIRIVDIGAHVVERAGAILEGLVNFALRFSPVGASVYHMDRFDDGYSLILKISAEAGHSLKMRLEGSELEL